jgi:hypothetical protein
LYLIIDGKDVTENEDMMEYPEVWQKIHAKLADHGFILRYLDGDEHITGYAYEPWHFRYVGLPHSRIMTDRGWALEEYLEHLQAGNQILLPAGDGTVWLVRYTRDYAEIAAMEQVESYSYDNCGGWVVTCRAENPGYYAENHWSEQYFKALLGDKPYGGFWDMVPDHTIPASGFLYLYSLLGDLPVPQLPAEEPMTRGQAALALDGLMGQPDGEVHPFVDDCRIDPRYKPSVYKLAAAGVLQGTTDGRFSPDTPLTWGEAATLLARLKVYLGK